MTYFIKLGALAGMLLFISSKLCGQSAQSPVSTYYFDGNDIVFVFDVRSYGQALKSSEADKLDFKDLKIHEVAITGAFTNWSKDGWKMYRKGEYLFELRKNLAEFNQSFPLEFKYIINGKFVTAPEGEDAGTKQFSDDFLQEVYQLDLSVLKVREDGNTYFELRGHHHANEVILTGSFNGWDEHTVKMMKGPQGWYLHGDLPPGRYEYKFIADGKWMHDPAAKENIGNEHGTLNSVLYVTRPVEFTLDGFPNAGTVVLTGSFINWDQNIYKMKKVGGRWVLTLPLAGGKHHYKFIVDGQWYTDPANPIIEDDGYGNLNSVLFVH